MNILGFSAGFHDAAAAVIDDTGNILFAGHSERYSKLKHDPNISQGLVEEILTYAPKSVAYYERPLIKQARQLYSGQGVDWSNITLNKVVKNQLGELFANVKKYSFNHHLCHAAAGFQTSPYNKATVVVIDAIGEFDTISIWGAEYDKLGNAKYKKLWGQKYPHSIGLFYSAMTKRVDLRPLDEEYILMGMAAYGDLEKYRNQLEQHLVEDINKLTFKNNLHLGVQDDFLGTDANHMHIAASAQHLVEDLIIQVINIARTFNYSNNLVYMGGVALNCLANRLIGHYFDNIWIMPNPGDAGSSIGAAALVYRKQLNWTTAFLGHNIPGPYPVDTILDHLINDRIVGVASGKAEFGPRALGNRSLLADPRGDEIKDQVNEIKRRQKFRPFAPIIMEELVNAYFEMPVNWSDSRYMQVIARCLKPDLFPAIIHADGTSRVQTVPADGSGIRKLLEAWYAKTGCPMLLNTSLNIRGEPMVNDRADADRFEQKYGVKVCS